MSRIDTKLTRLLGIKTPVIAAPMAGASGGLLAAQVTLGGGFGFMAAGYGNPEKFRHELSLARSALQIDSSAQIPVGVGFLGWLLDKPESSGTELLSIALENKVQAVWFAFGNRLGHWAQYVRNHDRNTGNQHKTIIFAQISSLDEAVVAISEWKVDVLVAQGIESGGHGHSHAPPLMTLLPSILSACRSDVLPILGAGGLTNGGHVASLIALGASGAVLGTRFLLSPESLYSDAQRQALVSAKVNSTARTTVFDNARGTLGWPDGIDGRALRNHTVNDFENDVDIKEIAQKFMEGTKKEDPDRMLIWAGTGVGLINSVKPAKEIVKEIHKDCFDHLTTAASSIA